jgi:hypothetical protein
MAIRSKPQQTAPVTDERAVEAFIGKGGGITKATDKPEAAKKLQLRLPDEIIKRIDAVRPRGIAAPSRHDWFAMIEKLEREEGQGRAGG